jgi:hypothetical protein
MITYWIWFLIAFHLLGAVMWWKSKEWLEFGVSALVAVSGSVLFFIQ